jgi:diguanylate cyclase (GGDEF)-like protein
MPVARASGPRLVLMQLDVLTLTVAGAFVALLSSLLIAVVASHLRNSPALWWWAGGTFLVAFGVGLLAISLHAPLLALVGAGALVISPALLWAGARRFGERRVPLLPLAAGPLVWLAVGLMPVADREYYGILTSFVVTPIYLLAAIFELWKNPRSILPARRGLTLMFGLHILTFLGGILDSLDGRVIAGSLPALNTWFGIINFEGLLFSVGSSLFMVLLAKEKNEQTYIAASRIDSMTGIANRGALLENGVRLLQRCQHDGRSFSLIMFDLDRFKTVNDTHGHAAGDEVIRTFTRTAQSFLRPSDFFGRYGGEEFVVALPNATVEAAYVIAERIRNAMATTPVMLSGRPAIVTVSAGVASAGSAAVTLEAILKIADDCLYRAKSAGRNRVERAPRVADETDEMAPLIRIA